MEYQDSSTEREPDALVGPAFIAAKQVEVKEQLANRAERGDEPYGPADMPEVGSTVEHIVTTEVYEVVGYKHQGGDRGWTLRIKPLDGGKERCVRPWMVEVMPDVDDEVEEVAA